MHSNADLINRFYTAFQRRDYAAMVACYHPQIEFSDPVFPSLRGHRARAMWRMLCERGTDLEIEFEGVEADETSGRAHWRAVYTFSPTGRRVENRIYARFRFEDGRIVRHRDSFDLWRWSTQALGWKGRLLGWTGLMREAVRRQAARSLDTFIRQHEDIAAAERAEATAAR